MGDFSDIVGRIGLSLPVQTGTSTSATTASDLDTAVETALTRDSGHTVISSTTAGYQIVPFGPEQDLYAPPVLTVDPPVGQALTFNGGDRVYVSSNPNTADPRWVGLPGLNAFYRLPDVDRETARHAWADRLAKYVPEFSQAEARAMSVPALRMQLAHHRKATFHVEAVPRGTPPVDAGGVVNGITLPTLRLPLREPDCYLPVIGQVEGKLESINAWDVGAGISLGVIQFNADRAALFRFLWQLWTDDPELFHAELTKNLNWTMVWDVDHPDLVVGPDVLHGRSADKARNAIYLQTGKFNGTGRNAPYRRTMAAALRNCVVWPHVQDMVVDVSAWYLQSALKDIRAAGIGPLNTAKPDRDTFVLTALLLSGRVRYSSCLAHVLVELRKWPTTKEKLANWKVALAATTSPCPDLLPRLKKQQQQAGSVYDQVIRLLGPA